MSNARLWQPIAHGPPVFVLDVSVPLAWLTTMIPTPYSNAVMRRMSRTIAGVPQTWAIQLTDLIRRRERAGQVSAAQVDAYFVTMSYFHIAIDGGTSAHAWGDTLTLSRVHNITVFDAAYLELALRLALPLASIDATLLRAAGAAGVPVFTP